MRFVIIFMVFVFVECVSNYAFADTNKPRRCGIMERRVARDIYEYSDRLSVRVILDVRADIAAFCDFFEDFEKDMDKAHDQGLLDAKIKAQLDHIEETGNSELHIVEQNLKVISVLTRINEDSTIVQYKRLEQLSKTREAVEKSFEVLEGLRSIAQDINSKLDETSE